MTTITPGPSRPNFHLPAPPPPRSSIVADALPAPPPAGGASATAPMDAPPLSPLIAEFARRYGGGLSGPSLMDRLVKISSLMAHVATVNAEREQASLERTIKARELRDELEHRAEQSGATRERSHGKLGRPDDDNAIQVVNTGK